MLFRTPETGTAGRPLRQRSLRAAAPRLALRAIAVALLVLVIAVVGAFVVLVSGPTEIGLVREQVVQVLRDGLGDRYRVSAGRSVIDVDRLLGGLIVRVDDVEIADETGVVVARVPETRFSVNQWALLSLRLEINAVEIAGAEMSFVRRGDGSVQLGTARTVAAADTAADVRPASDPTAPAETAEAAGSPPAGVVVAPGDLGFADLIAPLQILDRGMEPPIDAAIRAGFTRLALVDAVIEVWDAAGRQRRFANSNLNITVDPATSNVKADFSSIGFSGRWTAALERTRHATADTHSMSVVFSQLTVADLLPELSGRGPVSADIPIYGRANIDFDAAGDVEAANARIDLGAGVISFLNGRETLLLDEATVRLRWDIANRAVIVDPSAFYFGDTRGSITGRVQAVGEGADRTYAYNFQSPGTVLAPGDSGLPPLIAHQISVTGDADPSTGYLNIDEARIETGAGWIAAVGSLGFHGETPSLAAAATFSPMSISALKQMWVPLIAPGARRWVMENMVGGDIVSGTFEASVPPGLLWRVHMPYLPEEMMRLDMRVENATMRTFGELPPISNASGNVVLAGSTFGIDLEEGEIVTPSGVVNVDVGAFAIADASELPNNGLVELQISGPAEALGEIADAKPLEALAAQGLAPDDLSGRGRAAISIRIPLIRNLTEEDVDWRVAVETDGVASRVPIDGRNVSDADVEITVTPGDVGIYGTAKIDGVDADVSMALPAIAGETPAPGARLVRLILDDAARKKLGIGLENMLSGSITALVSDADNGGQHYELDLERARMIIPGIGWTKGIGVPARLSLDIRQVDGGHEISNLVFQGDGFGFHGSAMLDESYALESANIAHLSLREGDSVAIRITRASGSSGYAINARGESINLQGLITQVRDRYEQSGGFPDLALDAEIDRLVGFNQQVITGAELRLVSIGGETQKLSFKGALAGSSVSLEYAVAPAGTSIYGNAGDTGALLRFTDLYDNVYGGTAVLQGQGVGSQPMIGTFQITDFQVIDEPAMERVAVRGRDTGFNPGRVGFDRMIARFRRDERAITIEDALLRGTDVGATFAGYYEIASTEVSLTGTYLPAYTVNNLFGQIPVLGLALGGGFREGLFGVTFKIQGPLGEPKILVNPLSAVAPGIFRKIFEFQ